MGLAALIRSQASSASRPSRGVNGILILRVWSAIMAHAILAQVWPLSGVPAKRRFQER